MSNPSFREKIVWRRTQDWLASYRPQLVAVTGSSGRSIAAEGIRLALVGDRSVRVATPATESPLGVAKAILDISGSPKSTNWMQLLASSLVREISGDEPDALVVEVGATRPGDVDRVAIRIAPQVVAVTSVGSSHTRLLGEKELVAHEYESLIAVAGPNATTVLNADDELVLQMAERARGPVILVGHDETADVQIVRTHRLPDGGLAAELNVHGQGQEVSLPTVLGQHHLTYIAMGLAAAHALGVSIKQSVNGIKAFTALPRRLQGISGRQGSRLIDDTFDATPESIHAGLGTLRALASRRKIAVLGDITDLGGESSRVHQQLGNAAAEVAAIVVVVGQEMEHAGAAALRAGADVHHFETSEEVGKWLSQMVRPDDLVYVSGAKDMNMHDVVARLSTEEEAES